MSERAALKDRWFSNGLAMFSMFFGAGNVIFPLIIGFNAKGGVGYSIIGMILTAVIVPFLGLISITLFEGNYVNFFNRLGKVPGAFVTVLVLALVGPFGAMPRCITLTYSTLSVYFPDMNLVIFTLISSILIFILCMRKNRILDILGYVLTPMLILFLLIIVGKGLAHGNWDQELVMTRFNSFLFGLKQGYFTMDLLAAFFFSSIVCERLKDSGNISHAGITRHLVKASTVGAGLLALVYIGFATVSSIYSEQLAHLPDDHLLGGVGRIVLGPYGGFVICLAVALSCLTTVIALALVSAEFLQKYISRGKLSYVWNLVIVLVLTALVSMLEFSGIVKVLGPILVVAYPSFLLLSVLNILYKFFKFKPVKLPVFILFGVVLIKSLFFN